MKSWEFRARFINCPGNRSYFRSATEKRILQSFVNSQVITITLFDIRLREI